MLAEFKCISETCSEFNKIKEKNFNINQIPLCEICNKEMKRVWSYSGGIKTSDGYKS